MRTQSRFWLVFFLLLWSLVMTGCGVATKASAVGNPASFVLASSIGTVTGLSPAPVLSASHGSSCVVNDGAVRCWGGGPLGDGTITTQGTPVFVLGLTSGTQSVAVGYEHSCAVTSGGEVQCWGDNIYGQLGDRTTLERVIPVDVVDLPVGVRAVGAGVGHTCALTDAGAVKCWGWNELGQLGDGTTTDRRTPTDVVGLTSGVLAIAIGGNHSCALTDAGAVKCWGANEDGQVGDTTTTNRSRPGTVSGLESEVRALDAGLTSSCAVTMDGSVRCWGSNQWGQLGDGGTTDRSAPVGVVGLPAGVQDVTVGGTHACVLTDAGGLLCWGANSSGQLGDRTTEKRQQPVPVTGLTADVGAVSAGSLHTCAVSGGDVVCWGNNQYGQIGDGVKKSPRTQPAKVALGVATQPPTWRQQVSDFSQNGAADDWWTGCDPGQCASVKDGVYVIESKRQSDWAFSLFEGDEDLRAVTLTLNVASLSTKGRPAVGLACMTDTSASFPKQYYEISVTSDGILFFFRLKDGKYTKVREPVILEDFDPKHPPQMILSCESLPEGTKLSALTTRLYTAVDQKPLQTGGAALYVGNTDTGTSVVRFKEIDVVGELKP